MCLWPYLSLSEELELSWGWVSDGWNEVDAVAPLEERAEGQSEDPPMLQCVDKPRP